MKLERVSVARFCRPSGFLPAIGPDLCTNINIIVLGFIIINFANAKSIPRRHGKGDGLFWQTIYVYRAVLCDPCVAEETFISKHPRIEINIAMRPLPLQNSIKSTVNL